MAARVLILTAPFGSGHRRAAEAIAQACTVQDPSAAVDLIDLRTPMLDLAGAAYLRLVATVPSAYRSLYHASIGQAARRGIRIALDRSVERAIRGFNPTVIVATHPFPAAAAAHMRVQGKLSAPVSVVPTDFLPHPLWIHDGVDRYFVAAPQAMRRMQVLGVAPGLTEVTGIPIGRDFTAGGASNGPVRRVLLMGGGLGLGPMIEAARSLAQTREHRLRVTVACGDNHQLFQEMIDLFGLDTRFEFYGYTDRVPQLMARSDLLITKPGGLTCSEALTSSLPMLLLTPLPGQEEENAAYLVTTGAAEATDTQWIGRSATDLLFVDPQRLTWMREQARRAGYPAAADTIANAIFTLSEPNLHRSATA